MEPQAVSSDTTLVARMAAGDQDALSSLYDCHRGVIFALALRILRDRAEAEEVLTDVFLQAWRGASSFDRSRGSVSGWLVTLCRSRAIDRLRGRARREAGLAALSRDEAERARASSQTESSPEREVEARMKRRYVGEALAALSPQQRDAIELAYYSGLTHSEIASKLDEPLGTVKTRIRQGLMTLRESLGRRFAL